LPPYSPDLNPIEQTFAKIKHWMRRSVMAAAFVAAISGPAVVVATSRFDRRATLLALTLCLIVSSVLAGLANHLISSASLAIFALAASSAVRLRTLARMLASRAGKTGKI
jgi:predicted MFS family arabinose efflux permease